MPVIDGLGSGQWPNPGRADRAGFVQGYFNPLTVADVVSKGAAEGTLYSVLGAGVQLNYFWPSVPIFPGLLLNQSVQRSAVR